MRKVAVAVAIATLAMTGSSAAAPSADTLIRPGRAIGKAQLGMTEAQLRRSMGRPLAVVRRPAGFGRETAELQYADFELFVHLRGRRNALRVVRVVTYQRSERTPERVGVGVLRRTLLARYRGRLRCRIPETATYQRRGTTYVLDERCTLPGRGARTVFLLDLDVDPGTYFDKRQPTLEQWVRLARIEQVVVEVL